MSVKLLIFDSPHTHTQQLIKQFFSKLSSCSEGPCAEGAVMDSKMAYGRLVSGSLSHLVNMYVSFYKRIEDNSNIIHNA